jgi:hypothetical protein
MLFNIVFLKSRVYGPDRFRICSCLERVTWGEARSRPRNSGKITMQRSDVAYKARIDRLGFLVSHIRKT